VNIHRIIWGVLRLPVEPTCSAVAGVQSPLPDAEVAKFGNPITKPTVDKGASALNAPHLIFAIDVTKFGNAAPNPLVPSHLRELELLHAYTEFGQMLLQMQSTDFLETAMYRESVGSINLHLARRLGHFLPFFQPPASSPSRHSFSASSSTSTLVRPTLVIRFLYNEVIDFNCLVCARYIGRNRRGKDDQQ
jgi:hypothetical protein